MVREPRPIPVRSPHRRWDSVDADSGVLLPVLRACVQLLTLHAMIIMNAKTRTQVFAQFVAAAMVAHPTADAAEIVCGAADVLNVFERAIEGLPGPGSDVDIDHENEV